MTIEELHQNVIDTVGANAGFFLSLAEQITTDYAEDNGVGPADDPAVFISWLATVIKRAQLAGIDIAFQALKEQN